MRKSCCSCCVPFKPRYQRLVDNIFPANPNDGLVRNNMEKLTFFALSSPEKLDRIGEYLAKRLTRDVTRKRYGYVFIAMEALDQLLIACHAQTLNLFVESFLKMVQRLLECDEPDLNILATNSFVKFANIEEDAPSYHRRYDFFISKFTAMCHNNDTDIRARIKIRKSGLKGIHAVIKKTVGDDLQVNIYEPEHMKKIVPSLLYNMHDIETLPASERTSCTKQTQLQQSSPDILAEDDTNENEVLLGPHVVKYYKKEKLSELAESCLRELVSKASYPTLKSLLTPLMEHFDYHHLWDPPDTFAVKVLKLIMYSVRPQHTHLVIDMLLLHMEEHDDPNLRANVMKAISQIITLATLSSIGPSIHQWFNAMFVDLRKSVQTTSLDMKYMRGEEEFQQAIIHTMGEFAANLPDYQKIQVLIFIMNQVPLPDIHDRRDLMLFRRDTLGAVTSNSGGGGGKDKHLDAHGSLVDRNSDTIKLHILPHVKDILDTSSVQTNPTDTKMFRFSDPICNHDDVTDDDNLKISDTATLKKAPKLNNSSTRVTQDSKGRFRTELINENLTPSTTSIMSSPVVIIDHPLQTNYLDDLTVKIIDPNRSRSGGGKKRRFSLKKTLKKTKSVDATTTSATTPDTPSSSFIHTTKLRDGKLSRDETNTTLLVQSLPEAPPFPTQKKQSNDNANLDKITQAPSPLTPRTVERRRRNTKLQIMVLQSLLKVATKFTSIQYSATFPSNFLIPLLKMSVVIDKRVRLIVQEILHTLLDRHDNLAKLTDKSSYQYLLNPSTEERKFLPHTHSLPNRLDSSAKPLGFKDYKNSASKDDLNLGSHDDQISSTENQFAAVPADSSIINNNSATDDLLWSNLAYRRFRYTGCVKTIIPVFLSGSASVQVFSAVRSLKMAPGFARSYNFRPKIEDGPWTSLTRKTDILIEKCSHLDMYFMRKNGPFIYSAIYESALRLNNDNSNIKTLLITIALLLLELGSSQDIMIDIIKLLFALQKKCRDLPFIRPNVNQSVTEPEQEYLNAMATDISSSNIYNADIVNANQSAALNHQLKKLKEMEAISNASVKSLDLTDMSQGNMNAIEALYQNNTSFETTSAKDAINSFDDKSLSNKIPPNVEIFSLPAFLLELKIHSLLACSFSFLLRALDWWYSLYNVALDEEIMMLDHNVLLPNSEHVNEKDQVVDSAQDSTDNSSYQKHQASERFNSSNLQQRFNVLTQTASTKEQHLPFKMERSTIDDAKSRPPLTTTKKKQRDKVKALTDHVRKVLDTRISNLYNISKMLLPPKGIKPPSNATRFDIDEWSEDYNPREKSVYHEAATEESIGKKLGDVFDFASHPYLTGLPIPIEEMASTSIKLLQDDSLYFDVQIFKDALSQLGLDASKLETPLSLRTLISFKDPSTSGTPNATVADASAIRYPSGGLESDINNNVDGVSFKSISLSIESSSNSVSGSRAPSSHFGDDTSFFFDPDDSGSSDDESDNIASWNKIQESGGGLAYEDSGTNEYLLKSKRRKNRINVPSFQDINALSMKKIFHNKNRPDIISARANKLKQVRDWYKHAPFEEIMARSRCKEIQSRKNMQQLIFNNITRSPQSFYDKPNFLPYVGIDLSKIEKNTFMKEEISETDKRKLKENLENFKHPTSLVDLKFPQLIVY